MNRHPTCGVAMHLLHPWMCNHMKEAVDMNSALTFAQTEATRTAAAMHGLNLDDVHDRARAVRIAAHNKPSLFPQTGERRGGGDARQTAREEVASRLHLAVERVTLPLLFRERPDLVPVVETAASFAECAEAIALREGFGAEPTAENRRKAFAMALRERGDLVPRYGRAAFQEPDAAEADTADDPVSVKVEEALERFNLPRTTGGRLEAAARLNRSDREFRTMLSERYGRGGGR
jgi:hypothetical protein